MLILDKDYRKDLKYPKNTFWHFLKEFEHRAVLDIGLRFKEVHGWRKIRSHDLLLFQFTQ